MNSKSRSGSFRGAGGTIRHVHRTAIPPIVGTGAMAPGQTSRRCEPRPSAGHADKARGKPLAQEVLAEGQRRACAVPTGAAIGELGRSDARPDTPYTSPRSRGPSSPTGPQSTPSRPTTRRCGTRVAAKPCLAVGNRHEKPREPLHPTRGHVDPDRGFLGLAGTFVLKSTCRIEDRGRSRWTRINPTRSRSTCRQRHRSTHGRTVARCRRRARAWRPVVSRNAAPTRRPRVRRLLRRSPVVSMTAAGKRTLLGWPRHR